MPPPHTPPAFQVFQDILTELQDQSTAILALQAQVAAQFDHIEKLANFARWEAESFYGGHPGITGIWDDTDRY